MRDGRNQPLQGLRKCGEVLRVSFSLAWGLAGQALNLFRVLPSVLCGVLSICGLALPDGYLIFLGPGCSLQ